MYGILYYIQTLKVLYYMQLPELDFSKYNMLILEQHSN